jgi:hypothetical protein
MTAHSVYVTGSVLENIQDFPKFHQGQELIKCQSSHPSCEFSERNKEQARHITASCPVLSSIAVALPVPSLKPH